MIKITVEIKDEKFFFDYEVGASRHAGEQVLCAETMATFTEILKLCTRYHLYKDKEWERELVGKAWYEKQNCTCGTSAKCQVHP